MNGTSVTVVGNVASHLTVRRVGPQDAVVVSFRVMANERKWDRVSETWGDGDRFSARVSCWRRLGEHVRASLMRGDAVVVCGKLSVREYDVEGERRYSTEIEASAVGPDLTRCLAAVTRPAREEAGTGDVATVAVPGVPGLSPAPVRAGSGRGEDDPGAGPGGAPDEGSDGGSDEGSDEGRDDGTVLLPTGA